MTVRDTRFGRIFYGGACRDDYATIDTYRHPDAPKDWPTFTLQRPAIRSLIAAQRRLARKTRPKAPWTWRRGVPIRVTGSFRTCEFQREKYEEDPKRFAHPDAGVHTRGLAIDVHTGQLNEAIREALLAKGWHQSRPGDEPWHFSFGVTA